ncbi:MAG: CocE/NonD family hydrolase [Chloroflexota bacterium]
MTFLHDNMHIKRDFPREMTTIEHTWITLADGTKLAARIWLPKDAEQNPVPALLEYLPYRKNDMTAWRDSIRHPYLAGHGYAAVRVDMRGNGDSDGLMFDEYTPQELADALEVLAWLEAQPWCTGKVGMFGKSWGGFNALQVAALRPPQLKAIITIASTDDRYADDVHYMGGALLASEMLSWASTMFCYNASPPDPKIVGENWCDTWLNRLENTPPFVEAWVSHQRRDPFWQHGSVCENFSDIECAVYAVGGWADGYTNAVPRLLAGLTAPKKGLIGPWAHNFPENSSPAPAIGFLQESLRWWDYWLKDIDTGIMTEPMLTTWIQNSYQPTPSRSVSEGNWVVDENWPSLNVQTQALTLNMSSPQIMKSTWQTALNSEPWLRFGEAGSYSPDQRGDNGRSLRFTTEAQPETTILGFPEVTLTLKVDQPQASLAIRLCDVAPDGTATLVSWGLLNLSHREGHANPKPMPIGKPCQVAVRLNICGHRLAANHRWEVAISPTYWPHLWPSPIPVTLTIDYGTLHLPVRQPQPGDVEFQGFEPPECSEPLKLDVITAGSAQHKIEHDRITQTTAWMRSSDNGTVRFPDGLLFSETASDQFVINETDPLSATVHCQRSRQFERGDWRVNIQTNSVMRCDAQHFYLENMIEAKEGALVVFQRTWQKTIPRDFQ